MAKEIFLVNPRKRKRRSSPRKRRRSTSLIASSTRRVVRRKPRRTMTTTTKRRVYRRNPSFRSKKISMKNIVSDVTNAAVMAGGAIAVDMLATKLPVPAQYKTGQYAPLYRAAVAIGSGFLLNQLKMGSVAKQVTEGSLVVIAHDVITKQLGASMGLSAYEHMSDLSGYNDLSAYWDNSLLGYTSSSDNVVPMNQSVATLI